MPPAQLSEPDLFGNEVSDPIYFELRHGAASDEVRPQNHVGAGGQVGLIVIYFCLGAATLIGGSSPPERSLRHRKFHAFVRSEPPYIVAAAGSTLSRSPAMKL